MTLPAGQQRALDRIENALQACEPRMAARFDVFTQLTRGEDFPRSEQLERRACRLRQFLAGHLPRRRTRAGRCRRWVRRRLAHRSPAMLLPFALLAMTHALFGSSVIRPQARVTVRVRFACTSSPGGDALGP
jgi:hypothetical protein